MHPGITELLSTLSRTWEKSWKLGSLEMRTGEQHWMCFWSSIKSLHTVPLESYQYFCFSMKDHEQAPIIIEEEVQKTDKTHKQGAKEVANRKQNAKPQPLVPGEKALIKQRQTNKTTLPCIIILNPIPLSKLDDQKLLPRNPTEGDHPTQGVFQTTPTSWKTQQASHTSIKVRYENFWQQQTIKEQYAWQ